MMCVTLIAVVAMLLMSVTAGAQTTTRTLTPYEQCQAGKAHLKSVKREVRQDFTSSQWVLRDKVKRARQYKKDNCAAYKAELWVGALIFSTTPYYYGTPVVIINN